MTGTMPRIDFKACRRYLGCVALLLALGMQPAAAGHARMQSSVVRILCIVSGASDTSDSGSTTGSGFVVAEDEANTYIATNAHVAACLNKDNSQLILFLGPQNQLPLAVEKLDTGRDLAIVRAQHIDGHPPVRFADTSDIQSGDHVTAIGFPGAADEVITTDDAAIAVPTLTEGNIGRIITSSDNGVRYIQHSAAINPGNSGGPLFDDSGNVIGINTLKALKETIDVDANGHTQAGRTSDGEGIGMAVDAGQVMDMMRSAGLTPLIGYAFGLSLPILVIIAVMLAVVVLGVVFMVLRMRRPAATRPAQDAPAARPQARLRVISGALFGTECALRQRIVIGRDPARAQLVYPAAEPGISRRHCEVSYDAGSFTFEVTDLESSSGTFFENGSEGSFDNSAGSPRRLPPNVVQRLRPGSRIYLGSRQNCVALELV